MFSMDDFISFILIFFGGWGALRCRRRTRREEKNGFPIFGLGFWFGF